MALWTRRDLVLGPWTSFSCDRLFGTTFCNWGFLRGVRISPKSSRSARSGPLATEDHPLRRLALGTSPLLITRARDDLLKRDGPGRLLGRPLAGPCPGAHLTLQERRLRLRQQAQRIWRGRCNTWPLSIRNLCGFCQKFNEPSLVVVMQETEYRFLSVIDFFVDFVTVCGVLLFWPGTKRRGGQSSISPPHRSTASSRTTCR